MVYVEPSFPRGRKTESAEDARPRKKFRKKTDYGASTRNEEKLQKPRLRERNQARLEQAEQEREELAQSVQATPLQFKSAQEGMLVLGCVYKVHRMELSVSLPGRLFGRVPVTRISEAYGRRLQSVVESSGEEEAVVGLEELYREGDLVYVKIVGKDEERYRFELSLDPRELHSGLNCKHLVEGLVMAATVEEEEDHGYQMNVGVKNVRAFMPAKNVRGNRMEVGGNVFCAVEKVTLANGVATVILKAFKPNELRKLDVAAANIDSLMPGSVVTFTVESILPNGLQGTLFDDTVPAFVNENMLEKPLSKVDSFELFKQVPARILYVMPLTKHVFLTLAIGDSNRYSVAEPLPVGTVLKDAKVMHKCSTGGVWFQLGKKHKALLPRYTLKNKYNANYDEQIVMAKYQPGSLHTVRIIRYEVFDRTFIVTDDDATVGSRFFSLDDLRVGDVYDCRVARVLNDKQGLAVTLGNGRLKGIVMTHNYKFIKSYAPKQSIKLRLLGIDEERQQAIFTNHPEYLRKSAKLMLDRKAVKPDQKCLGTVISEQEKYFIVAFCNKITAILFKFCRSVTQDIDRINALKPGSVDVFTVYEVTEDGSKITLVLPLAAGGENLGHVSSATVTGIYATGLDVYLVKENETGTIPPEALSDFPEHCPLIQNSLREGDRLKVVNVRDGVFSCRDVAYFNNKPTQVRDVRVGQILRAYYVEPARNGGARFRLALKDYTKRVILKAADFGYEKDQLPAMEPDQVVLVKVKRVDEEEGASTALRVSARLRDVCQKADTDEALRYMKAYVDDVKQLVARFKSRDKPFAQYSIGQQVSCVVESFVEDADQLVVRLGESESEDPLAARGLARKDPKKQDSYTVGERLSGRVVWVDVERQLVHVCVTKKHLKHIVEGEQQGGPFNVDERHKLVTLFSNRYVAVGCIQKRDSPLVIVPVKTHYNDLEPVTEGGAKCTVVLVRNYEGLVCGLTEQTYERFRDLVQSKAAVEKEAVKGESTDEVVNETEAAEEDNGHSDSGIDKDDEPAEPEAVEKVPKKSKKKAKKALAKVAAVESPAKALKQSKKQKKALAKKLTKNSQPFVISQLDGTDDSFMKLDKIKKKKKKNKQKQKGSFLSKSPATVESGAGSKGKVEEKQVTKLPGAESFWGGNSTVRKGKAQSDSSDDEDDQPEVPAKKSRLTGKERFEAMKQEEKRIRQIEEELADASVDPHTPDQFDRLLLSQPNSSLLWIRYMVFHMESAEIDKARAVARRALKTINFREENERLNVWIALLNLELRYETIDTFKEILQEAVQYNDPYKVYSKVIEVLIDCGKTTEVLDMIELLQKRFRKQPEMWHLIASCYYKIDHRSKVKPLLSKALKSLENKEHIPLIVKFAFLHNRNGDRDEAHILFEQILTSYPKRTDIWSQYVDMLVKDGLVDVARQTLDRAIVQRLPMRNMKTLFTKYVQFEEKHGDREAVRRIKQQAAEYVERQLAEGKKGDE